MILNRQSMSAKNVVAVNGMLTASFATVENNGSMTTFRNGVPTVNKRLDLLRNQTGIRSIAAIKRERAKSGASGLTHDW